MKNKRRLGFTLVELLVVIGIIVMLVGIVYAYTGPTREKGRQTICISNLRQIGQALAMYRADYDGSDVASTLAEFGMPPDAREVLSRLYMGGNEEVFHCPNHPVDEVEFLKRTNGGHYDSYSWNIWAGDGDVPPSQFPPWGEALRERGSSFPITYDDRHNPRFPDRPGNNRFVIILRVDGSVSVRQAPKTASWKW